MLCLLNLKSHLLTHCGLLTPYGKTDSGDGLLPDGTEPLSEPVFEISLEKWPAQWNDFSAK